MGMAINKPRGDQTPFTIMATQSFFVREINFGSGIKNYAVFAGNGPFFNKTETLRPCRKRYKFGICP